MPGLTLSHRGDDGVVVHDVMLKSSLVALINDISQSRTKGGLRTEEVVASTRRHVDAISPCVLYPLAHD